MNSIISLKRFKIFVGIISVFVIYIVGVYTYLDFQPEKEIVTKTEEMVRGTIVDRNGKPLAVSTNFYHLSVTPSAIYIKRDDNEKKKNKDSASKIDEKMEVAKLIAPVLDLDINEVYNQFITNKKVFYLKKRLHEADYDNVKKVINENKIYGFRFDKIPGRVYPENNLAAQLIGFMGDDGEGLAGIEYSKQSVLSPKLSTDIASSRAGLNVYLTIDANLQYKLEKIAQKAMDDTKAESVMMIAADAKNGEILSYISLPSVNLNEYRSSSPEQQRDRPAVTAYEPGSVFKIFSVATFIDAGVVKPDEVFVCDGRYDVRTANGERVRITCLDHHGAITAREALQYSCNDALAQMSAKIDANYFLAKLRQLGFGSKTGIELPGETSGLVKSTNDKLWSGRSKPTISIGQEISVSALQMVKATTAITNGGIPAQLTVISKITDREGNEVYSHIPKYENKVFGPATASYLLSCMESTAKSGTGHRAALGDLSIGVKTGTAQMADMEHGGYSETDFLSNCVAVFPVEDPQVILYIVITKAQGETYAGRIVAPVVADAADIIIDHMGMTRGGAASLAHSGLISVTSGSLTEIGKILGDYTGVPKRRLTDLLSLNDVNIKIHGDGYVVSQNPAPGTPITENMTIDFYLE